SVAVGKNAQTTKPDSVALGANSVASVGALANYDAFGLTSKQSSSGEVNVGNRQITGVAPGSADQDAVNVLQVKTITASLSSSIGTATSSIASLSTGLSTATSSIGSLSTGLSTTNSNVTSLSTSTSTGLSTATSSISSLSTGVGNLSTSLNTTNSNLGSLSTTVNTINDKGTKYFHANSTAADSVASGQKAVAIGPQSVASGTNSFAAGNGARATGTNAIAIGTGALATGSQAIGANARAGGGGVALGDNADAGGTPLSKAQNISKGTAICFGAITQQSGGVALGSGSVASTAAGVAGYVPAGAAVQHRVAIQATTSTQAAVSVGDAAKGQYRQITGVAAGTADSDATYLAQLKASAATVKASSVQYATNPDGSVNYNQVTLGNGQAPGGTRIG
ncbi:YadA family autotransporter adhesin, partial [Variovorax sp. RHLX14]|uniref:YadA family autotransporter adhesin n=1 Tax=Variovorax sp. RHLX14 TaxID=1259731 RepID=UPI003F45DC3B